MMCVRGLGLTLYALLATLSPPEASAAGPYILFCMADDWGWPHAGAYGDNGAADPAYAATLERLRRRLAARLGELQDPRSAAPAPRLSPP